MSSQVRLKTTSEDAIQEKLLHGAVAKSVAILRSVQGISLRFPNLKIGTSFRDPPALPPCCEACTLTSHPFTYAPFGVLIGRRPT